MRALVITKQNLRAATVMGFFLSLGCAARPPRTADGQLAALIPEASSTMEMRLKVQPDPLVLTRVAATARALGFEPQQSDNEVRISSPNGGDVVVSERDSEGMVLALQGGADDAIHREELTAFARAFDAAAGPTADAFLRRLRWALKVTWSPPAFLLTEDPSRERYGTNPRTVGMDLVFDTNGRITAAQIDRTSGIPSLDSHVETAFRTLTALGPVPEKLVRRGQVSIDLRVELAELPNGTALVAARAARGEAHADAEPMSQERQLRERQRLLAALDTRKSAIRLCYEDERAFNSKLKGSLIARLQIDDAGRVTHADASGNSTLQSEPLEECVLSALRSMVFSVPPDAQAMTLEYTIDFPNVQVASGSLVEDQILRVFRDARPRIKNCYERELAEQPSLSGRATATLAVDSRGRVAATALRSSSLNEVNVEQCVLDVVQTLVFPKPQGGLAVVEYPMNFDHSTQPDSAFEKRNAPPAKRVTSKK